MGLGSGCNPFELQPIWVGEFNPNKLKSYFGLVLKFGSVSNFFSHSGCNFWVKIMVWVQFQVMAYNPNLITNSAIKKLA